MKEATRTRWFTISDNGFTLFEHESLSQDTKYIETVLYPQDMQDEYNERTKQAFYELSELNMNRTNPRKIAVRDLANE